MAGPNNGDLGGPDFPPQALTNELQLSLRALMADRRTLFQIVERLLVELDALELDPDLPPELALPVEHDYDLEMVDLGGRLGLRPAPMPSLLLKEDADDGERTLARALLKVLDKRADALRRIGERVRTTSIAYFLDDEQSPTALDRSELAAELGMAASTVERLAKGKVVRSARGDDPLDRFLR